MSLDKYMVNYVSETAPQYVDLNGHEVKRTPLTNPYNFEEYVEWQNAYQEDDSAVYSDRLRQWDPEKYDRCYKDVFDKSGQMFNSKNPVEIQQFLSMYMGHEVKLTAILRGCNYSSGFPYWVFCYRE